MAIGNGRRSADERNSMRRSAYPRVARSAPSAARALTAPNSCGRRGWIPTRQDILSSAAERGGPLLPEAATLDDSREIRMLRPPWTMWSRHSVTH